MAPRDGFPARNPQPAGATAQPRDCLAAAVSSFAPISLAEMDNVALLDRYDTKYVLSDGDVADALSGLQEHYRILEVEDVRLQPYHTVYFDTPEFSFYRDHHGARPNRYKVRSREYVATHISFLEVKCKGKRDRTIKTRVRTDALVREIAAPEEAFVEANAPRPTGALLPRLTNDFRRITLVDLVHEERVTIDVGLAFSANGESAALPGVVIAEVKEAGSGRSSAFAQRMRALNVHPSGFSKYCIGVAMLYPGQKHNRFNPELLGAQRIIGEQSHVG